MASEARATEAGAPVHSAIGVAERSRQVWIVLALCLFAFIGLCGTTAYGLSSFLSGFTVAQGASLEPYTDSTLAVVKHGTIAQEQVSDIKYPLQEGDSVIAEGNNRALVRLFDESVLRLSFGTQVTLDTLRTNEFFGRAQEVRLILNKGSMQVNRSDPQGISTRYVVSSDQAEVDVDPGARVRFTVDDDNMLTEVVVDAGKATFRSKGEIIELGEQQMAWVSSENEPHGPLVAETDLVNNGTFQDGPSGSGETVEEGGLGVAGWLPIRDEGSIPVPSGSITITKELDHPVAHIHYEANPNQYARVGMVQTIDKSTEFYNTIELSATVKLVGQQEAGAGGLNDPYPLTVRVVYADSEGKLHEWKRAFYFGEGSEDITDLTKAQLPVGKWESTSEISRGRASAAGDDENLAKLNTELFNVKSPGQNPDVAFINVIEIYGTGTSFESWVTDVSLLAR